VLSWNEDGAAHVCVLQTYLETRLHLRVGQDEEDRVAVDILEDASARADAGRRWLEDQKRALAEQNMPYIDSHSPEMAEASGT
jgi:hypothetical protein